MMTGYDPYDPYRDDRRDRSYDRTEPYPEPSDQYGAGSYDALSGTGQYRGYGRDQYSRDQYGEAQAGPGPYGPGPYGGRYETAGDSNATQAYSPADPSFSGAPGSAGSGAQSSGTHGAGTDPLAFWEGLESPPAPPQPDRREPSGGYWDRIAEAPSAYASSDRDTFAAPPSNATETYSPASPAAGNPGSAYGSEPTDSPYRDSPWERSDNVYARNGYTDPQPDSRAGDSRYGGASAYPDSGYSDYPYQDRTQHYQDPYQDPYHDPYQNARYQDTYQDPYQESSHRGQSQDAYRDQYPDNAFGSAAATGSGYADARYSDDPFQVTDQPPRSDGGYSGYGGGASSLAAAAGAGYGTGHGAGYGAGHGGAGPDDYRSSSAAGTAADPAATQAFSMPFDSPEPTDTPPAGYGPASGYGLPAETGYSDRSSDPYRSEPTDARPGEYGGTDVFGGAAGAAAMPGALPGALPPAAPPGALPDALARDLGPADLGPSDFGSTDLGSSELATSGRPPAGPYAPASRDYDGPVGAIPPANDLDEFGDSGHLPSAYEPEPPVPRRVDLPDEVLAPLGTGGRRLIDEDGEGGTGRAEARAPYGRADGTDPGARRPNRTQDPDAAGPSEQRGSRFASVGIWVGVVVGLGLAAASALSIELPTLVGTFGAAMVAWMLTAVLVRRGTGMDWWVSGLAGVIPGALVLGSSFAPGWFRTLTVLYVAASAGAAAVALTKPVRRLSELVLEYVVAVGVAFAGGGAVGGLLAGEPIGLGLPSVAIALGFGLTLAVAGRAQTRLGSVTASRADLIVYAGLVLAATVGAGSLAVLLGAGDGTLGSLAERLEDVILDFRLIVIVPLALLGSAVVVRAFTPFGWWIGAVAALSTTAMASAFAGTNPKGRVDIAPTLASSFVGYVLGFVVTVGVAFLIGVRMRSASARRGRGGRQSQYVDEPGRLGGL